MRVRTGYLDSRLDSTVMTNNNAGGPGESPVDRFDEDGGVPQRRFTPPEGSTTIYLVRHGATEAAHPDRPFKTRDGHGDPALAPEGIDQAQRVGRAPRRRAPGQAVLGCVRDYLASHP